MATTTPNYGWDVPTSTDYVKDGATAIETLGDDIDASLFSITNGKNVGLVLLSSTALSASSSAQINNVFSSTYSTYRIVMDIKSSVSYQMYAQLSASGTPVTTSTYSYASRYFASDGSGGNAESTGSATYFTLGYNNTSGSIIAFDIANPGQANQTTLIGFNGQGSTHREFAGIQNNATAYDGIKIAPVSASTMTGNIQVYGYRQ